MVSIGYEEMMAVSPDYLRLIDETKRTLLEYAVQDWPVVKSTVRNCFCIIDHKNDIKLTGSCMTSMKFTDKLSLNSMHSKSRSTHTLNATCTPTYIPNNNVGCICAMSTVKSTKLQLMCQTVKEQEKIANRIMSDVVKTYTLYSTKVWLIRSTLILIPTHEVKLI